MAREELQVIKEQVELDAGLGVWVNYQENGSNHGGVTELPVNLIAHPEQSINVTHVDQEWPQLFGMDVPAWLFLRQARKSLGKAMGSPNAVNRLTGGFQNQPSSDYDLRPLTETIPEILGRNEHIGLVFPHGRATDLAEGMVGLQIALGERIRPNPYIFVEGKLMTRIKRDVGNGPEPVVDILKPLGDQLFVIPNTKNTKNFGISKHVQDAVNTPAMRHLLNVALMHGYGRAVAVSPTGTGAEMVRDADGTLTSIILPEIPDNSASLLARMQWLLAVSLHTNPVTGEVDSKVSKLIDVRKRRAKEIAHLLPPLLQSELQAVSGIPVELHTSTRSRILHPRWR